MQKIFAVFAVWLVSTTSLFAEGTRTWEQSSYDELEQGTARGVAIRSQGGIELAPAFAPLLHHAFHLHLVDCRRRPGQRLCRCRIARARLSGYAAGSGDDRLPAFRASGAGSGRRQGRRDLCRHLARRQGLQDRANLARPGRRRPAKPALQRPGRNPRPLPGRRVPKPRPSCRKSRTPSG